MLIVLLDDVGFAQFGCFGAEIETPNIDRLSADGLRYNRFHVTSICSASRAALMTGRNHHAVGMGSVADGATEAPGYTARLPQSAATLQRLLRDDGYSTFAVGKWHLTPNGERGHAGPYRQWPLGTGFERYYGFLRADANQWMPNLVRDNHPVDPPAHPDDGYHLTEDLADQAIGYLLDQRQHAPDRPFFLYFAPGAMHAPHQVAQEWIDRYAGRFDDGWERMRSRIFERQLESGTVPPGTTLTDRPSWIPAWEDLPPDDRRLYARMHEVYAAMLTHTDAQIGRLLTFLDEIGELDDTIVIVTSDNGASAEGGEIGAVNEHAFTQQIAEDHAANLAAIDDWGGRRGYYHYAWGWAWAGNTPLQLWKRYAWLGGTRTPMVVHWPAGIEAAGELRAQFCHIVDLMPTVLELCGVDLPERVDGVPQQRLDGASIAATFDDAAAPNPRDLQYFEMMGSRGVFVDEWKATTDHVMPLLLDEVRLLEGSRRYEDDRWQLFDLRSDFSEAHDVAAGHPKVLARLVDRWHDEAERNNVFPLLGGWDPGDPSAPIPARTEPIIGGRRLYRADGRPVTDEALPNLAGGGTVTAHVDAGRRPSGVLCAIGDWTQGWALFVDDGRLTFCLNVAGDETIVQGRTPVSDNVSALAVRLGGGGGEGVTIELFHDGRPVGEGRAARGVPLTMLQVGGAGLCIGGDRGFPVTERYLPPAVFTGVIHYVEVESGDGPPDAVMDRVARALHED
ncbi:MAG: arylsulfatase [Actinomycetota bacterium]